MSEQTSELNLVIKWNGKDFPITNIPLSKNVLFLKQLIAKETNVLPGRQKLLGLKCKGNVVNEETMISELVLKAGAKIMMMGSTEDTVAKANEIPLESDNVVNDLDIEEEEIEIKDREEYLAKVGRRIKEYKVKELNPSRDGKQLLVLDIDYTLFDHRSTAETGLELMRPYLHEFLTAAYEDYDIVIWSATSMKWIEEKMKLLGVSTSPNYKISFYLDSLAMITVSSSKYGIVEVKPLGVIWGKYPQWSEHNTIMFDDIRRNFIMNPQTGLKIRPFRKAHVNRASDQELLKLSIYLKEISHLESFTCLDHSKWESYSHANSDSNKKRKHSSDKSGVGKS